MGRHVASDKRRYAMSITTIAEKAQQHNTVNTVKVHPEIGRAAIALDLSLPFRMWTILRAIDGDGRGVVGHDAAMRAWAFYGMDRWHVRRAIKAQAETGIVFFEIHPTKVTYSSIKSVSLALDVTRAVAPVLISTAKLRKLGTFNAAVYAAWVRSVGGDDGLMMSRARLGDLWQRSDQQLRAWERSGGVRVEYNCVEVTLTQRDAESAIPKDDRLTGDRLDQRYIFERTDETGTRRFYQTVNRYRAQGATCPRGQVRKAARAARGRSSLKVQGARVQRVFFTQAALKAGRWFWSVNQTSILGTTETITGQRRARVRGADVVLSRRHDLHVWRFCALAPVQRGRVTA